MQKKSIALVFVSNAPGELETWVKPVVKNIKQNLQKSNSSIKKKYSIRLCLVPCPNAAGNEFRAAQDWKQFDLITPAKYFWKLLYNPFTFGKWPKDGIVIFLGGDQFWSVLLSKRLKYKCITYAEWIARWPQWNTLIAAMNENVKQKLPRKYHSKCIVIGDLMTDLQTFKSSSVELENKEWIAILPGSKRAKLSIGIPFFLEVIDKIAEQRNDLNFIIPLATTVNIEEIIFYQSYKNPISKCYSSKIKKIYKLENSIFEYAIETFNNTKIHILTNQSKHLILSNCKLAITTVGANTAELAALNLPMIVVLPTQHLQMMNAWDGIIGVLGKIPFINKLIIFVLKSWLLMNKKFFAWPNIKAKRLIVPERIGRIFPDDIANEALFLIMNKKQLKDQKNSLLEQRGKSGAVAKLSQLILDYAEAT